MIPGSRVTRIDRCFLYYAVLLISLTLLAIGVYLFSGRAPLNKPLFDRSDRFRDLTNYGGKVAHLDQGGPAFGKGLPVFPYPAPAVYLYAFLLRGFRSYAVRAFFAIFALGLLCGARLLWKAADCPQNPSWPLRVAILTTLCFGYPAIFVADRGNLEAMVALVLGTGVLLFIRRNWFWSAAFIGLAGALKPFPALFLLLFLVRKRFGAFGFGTLVMLGTVLLSLTTLGPDPVTAYRGLSVGVKLFSTTHILAILPLGETRFEHSIMDTLKMITRAWAGQSDSHLRLLLSISMVVGATGVAFVFLRMLKLPAVNQMTMLAVSVALFPPVAADYTLIHLYVPFGLLVVFLSKDVRTGRVAFEQKHALTLLTLYAALFSPMTFLGQYSGVCKTMLLLCLLGIAAAVPIRCSLFEEAGPKEGLNESGQLSSAFPALS